MAQQSITLTASMRSNLSSLKSIQKQMNSTQEKLSTGKKVNSAIDNASSYYQARALTNRAKDLEALLDSMGQGIQTIQAANEGIEAVTSYVEQLKSVANSAYALDSTLSSYEDSIESYRKQFDSIQAEITKLVADSSYQGVNLLRGNKLTITFNESRSNKFDVQGQDVVANMRIQDASDAWVVGVGDEAKTNEVVYVGDPIVIPDASDVYKDDGGNKFVQATNGKWYYLTYNDKSEVPADKVTGKTYYGELTDGYELLPGTAVDAGAQIYNVKTGDGFVRAVQSDGEYYNMDTGAKLTVANPAEDVKVAGNYAKAIDETITEISEAIDYLRSFSTELGNNYSIIETRQNFTESLIDVLESGADNLVLADMNEESANYLALQTRQQLAINSLSLASQSAQSILSLF